VTVSLFFAQIFLVVLVFAHTFAESWIFVAFYLVAALYAAINRLPLLTATGIAVAVVRAMVAEGVGGLPLEIATLIFAALLFLVVVEVVQARRGQR
jgi:hypothetical protein